MKLKIQILLKKRKQNKIYKNQIEQEFNLSPSTHKIITSKRYKKLIWYLIYKKKETKKKEQNSEENNYSNYKWITGLKKIANYFCIYLLKLKNNMKQQ